MKDLLKRLLDKELFGPRVKARDKILFAGNLATMLRSGLSITEALDILADEASGKLKTVFAGINRAVFSGELLSAACRRHPKIFSEFFINSVAAGEASGNLENNLAGLAAQFRAAKDLRDKITNAMLYPVILLFLSLVLGLGFAFIILPKLTPIFQGLDADLPLPTKALLWLARVVEHDGAAVFAGLIVGLALIGLALKVKRWRAFFHYFILHAPIVKKAARSYNLANLFSSLGLLLKSGLSLDEALRVSAGTIRNHWYKKELFQFRQAVSGGAKLSDCFGQSRYFPRLTAGLARVGEKSGNLEEEMADLAEIYRRELERQTQTMAILVEPVMLIGAGIVVGFLALSIMLPIYQITGNIYR